MAYCVYNNIAYCFIKIILKLIKSVKFAMEINEISYLKIINNPIQVRERKF